MAYHLEYRFGGWDGGPDSGGPPTDPFDPILNPDLFEGVLPRRVIAFLIDAFLIAAPVALAAVCIFIFGIVTFGLGWALFWVLSPGAVVWAVCYYGLTLGGSHSATIGMRAAELEMRTLRGYPSYFVLGAVHAILFWISVSALTPLVLLICFFNHRRRLLHDILMGTIVTNNQTRARRLRESGPTQFGPFR